MILNIVFDNDSHIFSPGESITGKVVVESHGHSYHIFHKSSGVIFVGKAVVYDDVHNHEEIYFLHKIFLGSTSYYGPSEAVLKAGKSEFFFHFQLPYHIPGNYGSDFGSIGYYAEATLIRRGKRDLRAGVPLFVKPIYDLNAVPSAFQPGESYVQRPVHPWLHRGGPAHVVLKIPRKGYVPGEKVHFFASVMNECGAQLKMELHLKQMVKFYAGNRPINKKLKTMKTVKGPLVQPNDLQMWEDHFSIPTVDPTTSNVSTLIKIKYSLQLEVSIAGNTMDGLFANSNPVVAEVHIVIGTLPICDVNEAGTNSSSDSSSRNEQEQEGASSLAVAGSMPSQWSISSLPAYSDTDKEEAPPPSYEEVIASIARQASSSANKIL